MGSITDYLENKTILVTGGTGFLGKIFVEKILRVQPNIKNLYFLIRASDPYSAFHRLHSEVISKDLFRVLKEKHGKNMNTFISEKVIPVAGDIGLENFGVTNLDLLNEMWRTVDVVVCSAASTMFDERYDVAFATNTLGVEHVSDFVNNCTNIKLLLHVSTAYVSGERSGIIFENPFKMGETLNGKNDLNIKEERLVIQDRHRQLVPENADEEAISSAMKNFGLQRANLHGWPNTYVFTKAMGEMLLLEGLRKDVSLVILRPTIITSTYKEPFPGWIEGIKTIDGFIASYGKGRTSCFLSDPDKVLDLIPGDMVINAMILAMVAHMNKPYSRIIYHVGSSMSNPLSISSFRNCVIDYFIKHPLMSRQGSPIITTRDIKLLTSTNSFNRYVAIRYMIPLKGIQCANILLCQTFSAWCHDAERKIKIVLRLAELFKPYVLIHNIFDDANLNILNGIVSESIGAEKETFFLDVKSINWEDYFTNIHIPGLVKYALK
ncbi:fatty acyl-CoA reductase 3 [Artemisia annua]|uniref:Fatty acyl-CoA reductase n=1 Tax=Artemisia annua TaxID=35608 RepID=A0A2U1M6D7_ARTAN|nr:fatty acyl-CoA reductase 3 [Artemisia annua]